MALPRLFGNQATEPMENETMDNQLEFPPHAMKGSCAACPSGFEPCRCNAWGCNGLQHVVREFQNEGRPRMYLLQCSACGIHRSEPGV